jgi:nitrogen regulatory protein PII
MKLLLITCIQEYEENVKEILKHSGVKSFSYQSVKGYKNENEISNWFVSSDVPTKSLLFTVFIENQCMDDIFERIEKFNTDRTALSKVHVACLVVDQSI